MHETLRTRKPLRLCLLVALTCALGLAAPGAAGAVNIGLGQAEADPSGTCSDLMLFNVTTTFGGPNYIVPPGEWRLTSYSIAGGTSGGVGTLVVLRLIATDPEPEFLVVFSGAPQPLTAGVVNTFPANVRVEPGDVIALWMGSGECGVFTGSGDDIIAVGAIDEPPSEGEILTPPFFIAGFQVNIAAILTAISPPPPPPRAAVCTRTPVLRGDGTFGLFADVLVSQLDTTDESSPYFGARPAIYVEGYGLVCQITDIVTYGGNPADYRDSGNKVDGTGAAAPPGLEAVWVAPYAYWVRAP